MKGAKRVSRFKASGRIVVRNEVYEELLADIRDGTLKPGDKLLARRKAADELGISDNIIGGAYKLLRKEGYLVTRTGSGTFVARVSEPRRRGTRERVSKEKHGNATRAAVAFIETWISLNPNAAELPTQLHMGQQLRAASVVSSAQGAYDELSSRGVIQKVGNNKGARWLIVGREAA